MLNGLPPRQQDYFFRNIGIGNAKTEKMLAEGANRDEIIKHVMISAVDGLVDLSQSGKRDVIALYKQHGNDPLSRGFVMGLDLKYSSGYSEKFDGFVSGNNGETLTVSVPFSRMYKWVVKTQIGFVDQELKLDTNKSQLVV